MWARRVRINSLCVPRGPPPRHDAISIVTRRKIKMRGQLSKAKIHRFHRFEEGKKRSSCFVKSGKSVLLSPDFSLRREDSLWDAPASLHNSTAETAESAEKKHGNKTSVSSR